MMNNGSSRITRRRLLKGLVLIAAGLTFTPVQAATRSPLDGETKIASNFYPGIKKIGNAYLARHPHLLKTRCLHNSLREEGFGIKSLIPHISPDLKLHIETDFLLGHTTRLDGWLLSLTETKICALVCIDPANKF